MFNFLSEYFLFASNELLDVCDKISDFLIGTALTKV